MAAIVEYSRDAILSTDPDGIITSWNHAAQNLFGYASRGAIGVPGIRLAPLSGRRRPSAIDRFLIRAATLILTRRSASGRTGGASRWCCQYRPCATCAAGSWAHPRSRAICRRKNNRKRQFGGAESFATAGRLAASIAHEINNPLEAVVNLLYLAREDSANATQYLTMAEQEVGRVAQLAPDARLCARHEFCWFD